MEITESRKIKAEDLCKNRTFEEVKAILKAEGDSPCDDNMKKIIN